jgi:hypothetical protein
MGPSNSVNRVIGPTPSADDCVELTIEMQSGDEIHLKAAHICLAPDQTAA